ncbi:MAG: FG-GAP-like repeat-containing protein [Candidatus Sulfotelmatobacter sp.]
MLPASLRGFALSSNSPLDPFNESSSDGEFHLHPHYRSERPLDKTLSKVQPGLDGFVSEKYHDRIALILAEWSSSLLQSPRQVQAIEQVLSAEFAGSSMIPAESRPVRTGPPVEVHQNKFVLGSDLGRDAFLQAWRSSFSVFSKITSAEFQVTRMQATPAFTSQTPQQLSTHVRYEVIGTGDGFYREQRVGVWDLEWESQPSSSAPEFRLRRWQTRDETRSRSAFPIFTDISCAALGLNSSYSAQLLEGVDHWRTVLDGACGIDIYGHNGVSVADIDNDGFEDLYICQPAGLPNRLYRNRGDGTFEDITATSGLGILDNTSCAIFADFNNNGHQDVVIVRASGPLLFVNKGDGTFRQKVDAFPFANPPQGTFTGAAVADYDRDGWLDIYFCLYVYYRGTDQYKYPVPYHDAENGPPNFMMRNNRDGTFRDVTADTGLNQNNTRYSFCCGWSDYNGDGWPDLYVVNDFGRKNLYRNNGNGTFTDVAARAGVEDIGAGMSVCWNDFDNDGVEDLYVADMWTAAGERISSQENFKKDAPESVRALYRKHAVGNSLFRNSDLHRLGSQGGDRAFEDETSAAGVGMGRWSWSSDAFDFDHDGFSDLYIANGMISGPSHRDLNSFFWRQVVANSPGQTKPAHDYEEGWSAINELIRADGTWSGFERNVFYANNRDGTFSNVSGAVGLDFIEDGRAFALADFDHDGRQEIFLKNRNAPQLRVLKNRIENLPPSITFRLRGTKSNRDAVGAAITVETKSGRQTRMLQVGSGFLSQHSKEVFFGLGEAKGAVQASIRWPSGLVQEIHDLPLNHRIWVEEGSENFRTEPFKAPNPFPNSLSSVETDKVEPLPTAFATWLLVPVAAPDFSLPDVAGGARTLSAFRGKPLLLNFWTAQSSDCLKNLNAFQLLTSQEQTRRVQVLSVNIDDEAGPVLRSLVRERGLTFPILRGADEVSAIYNILYRYLFDRHRDMGLPTSFLIDQGGDIVKIYQGRVKPEHIGEDSRAIPENNSERLALALPFPGVGETFEFGRNYLSLGSVFFQRGYIDQAAASFDLALRDDPSSAEACYGLGSAYLSQNKTDQARETFERATKLHADYPDTLANAWNNLGLLATREGHTDEAIRCFRAALQLNPDHLIALDNLGNAFRLQKNWDDARRTFDRGLAVNPSDPEANYGLAMVFAQADDNARAYEYLQRALKARPVFPEALNNLGILYLRTQRQNEAVASFEECIRVAPGFDQSYLNLAKVYVLEAAPDKARSVLIELLKQHPSHAQAQSMLGQLPH